jgi:hypothetical protein
MTLGIADLLAELLQEAEVRFLDKLQLLDGPDLVAELDESCNRSQDERRRQGHRKVAQLASEPNQKRNENVLESEEEEVHFFFLCSSRIRR